MIGPVRPTCPHTPQIRAKDDYRQKEENAGNFEPDDAADAPEGTEKTAYAADNASTCLSGGPPCGFDSIRCVSNGLGLSRGLIGSLPRGSGFCGSRKPFARHFAGNAQSRTKNTANKLSSHTVYDGSSDAG